MKRLFYLILFILNTMCAQAQNDVLPKVHHAEPIYMDLIRDLGARRGEQELNIGGSIQSNNQYVSYSSFIEYEFALFNRLGIEVEIPFEFYHTQSVENSNSTPTPKNRIEGLKLSTQYTFLVSSEHQMSMAVGYTNEFVFHSFKTLCNENRLMKGNLYSPFFVAAKKWGKHLHTMLIAGSMYEQVFSSNTNSLGYQFHGSVFHVFSKNGFAGFELNHVYLNETYSTVLHPEVKYKISPSVAIGVVTAIPINQTYEPSIFFRFIYEPKRKL